MIRTKEEIIEKIIQLEIELSKTKSFNKKLPILRKLVKLRNML